MFGVLCVKRFAWVKMLVFVLGLSVLFTSCTTAKKSSSVMTTKALEETEITDTNEIQRIWKDYIFDTIATLGNSKPFNQPSEIEPAYLAGYCGNLYVRENGLTDLKQEESYYQFPLKTALHYAKRYFNLSSIDVAGLEADIYDPKRQVFLLNLGNIETAGFYNERKIWDIDVAKITHSENGIYKVYLNDYKDRESTIVERTFLYTMKQNPDKSLVFLSGKKEWINNQFVSLKGNFTKLNEIKNFEEELKDYCLSNSVGDKQLLYTPYLTKNTCSVMLYNSKTKSVEKKITISGENDDDDEFYGLSLFKDKFIVKLSNKMLVYDWNLTELKTIALPQILKDCYKNKHYKDGIVEYGGYDIAKDLKTIVFTDAEGIKQIDVNSKKWVLLSKTKPEMHASPRYVCNETKILTTILGYEEAKGYALTDVVEKKMKTYISGDDPVFQNYNENGILSINTWQNGKNKSIYTDFKTGKTTDIILDKTGDTGVRRNSNQCDTGKNYAAFVTVESGGNDRINTEYHLNRIDLKTLKIEYDVVTCKAADISIMNVYDDGSVLFHYNYNPSESGVCISGKALTK